LLWHCEGWASPSSSRLHRTAFLFADCTSLGKLSREHLHPRKNNLPYRPRKDLLDVSALSVYA
jgi:hypothetical protein